MKIYGAKIGINEIVLRSLLQRCVYLPHHNVVNYEFLVAKMMRTSPRKCSLVIPT
jgi:hypothetical protein